MDIIFWIGIAASGITAIQFLPQLLRAYKTQQTKDISGQSLALIILGNVLWLGYGIPKADIPIILASVLVLICVGGIAQIKYTHHKATKK